MMSPDTYQKGSVFEFYLDETLRDFACDEPALKNYLSMQVLALLEIQIPLERTRRLCELASGYRLIRDLEIAKNYAKEALDLCETYCLDLQTLTRTQIVLAQILQWQNNFLKSNRLFGELIISVESDIELSSLKSFIYQHAGKNLFDQHKYEHALRFFEKAKSLRAGNSELESSSDWAIRITKEKLETP